MKLPPSSYLGVWDLQPGHLARMADASPTWDTLGLRCKDRSSTRLAGSARGGAGDGDGPPRQQLGSNQQ
eukprot:scaffold42680_cov34-Tisochrysis_lutea.AAC.3